MKKVRGLSPKILLISLIVSCYLPLAMACHKGGPMGLAKGHPGMLSADFTYSSTFIFASTSGTSGCKNWDFVQFRQETQIQYIGRQWEQLSEEAARGFGPHLTALAQLMGCPPPYHQAFGQFIQEHYAPLFDFPHSAYPPPSHAMLKHLNQLLGQHAAFAHICQLPLPELPSS